MKNFSDYVMISAAKCGNDDIITYRPNVSTKCITVHRQKRLSRDDIIQELQEMYKNPNNESIKDHITALKAAEELLLKLSPNI